MESAASEIMTYDAQLIPGLLQTDEYARAVAAAEPGYETDEQREDVVAAAAMRRQAVLDGRRLSVVLGEGTLLQAVGGPRGHGRAAQAPGRGWLFRPTSRSRCCRSRPARTAPRAAAPWPS